MATNNKKANEKIMNKNNSNKEVVSRNSSQKSAEAIASEIRIFRKRVFDMPVEIMIANYDFENGPARIQYTDLLCFAAVKRGSFTCIVNSKPRILEAGKLHIIAPGSFVVDGKVAEKSKLVCFYINSDFARSLVNGLQGLSYEQFLSFESLPMLNSLLRSWHELIDFEQFDSGYLGFENIIVDFLDLVSEIIERNRAVPNHEKSNVYLKQLKDHFREEQGNVTAKTVSQYVGVSQKKLESEINSLLGVELNQLIASMKAEDLRREMTRSITIDPSVTVDSVQAFSRAWHVTPSNFRDLISG